MTLSVTLLFSPAVPHHKNHLSALSSPRCEGITGLRLYFLPPWENDSWKQVTYKHSLPRLISQRDRLGIPGGVVGGLGSVGAVSIHLSIFGAGLLIQPYYLLNKSLMNERWAARCHDLFISSKNVFRSTVHSKEMTRGHRHQLAHRHFLLVLL